VVDIAVAEGDATSKVAVVDHGPGVAQENVATLFEPFFTTKPKGTGLGLALSRTVAQAHGGDVHYTRIDGRTEFTLEVARG
jgi:signal transduction histidine kinase